MQNKYFSISNTDFCFDKILISTFLYCNLLFLAADLLEKVGELVETLFDLDEDMMKSWITAQPKQAEGDVENDLGVASYLLEAAKQLR